MKSGMLAALALVQLGASVSLDAIHSSAGNTLGPQEVDQCINERTACLASKVCALALQCTQKCPQKRPTGCHEACKESAKSDQLLAEYQQCAEQWLIRAGKSAQAEPMAFKQLLKDGLLPDAARLDAADSLLVGEASDAESQPRFRGTSTVSKKPRIPSLFAGLSEEERSKVLNRNARPQLRFASASSAVVQKTGTAKAKQEVKVDSEQQQELAQQQQAVLAHQQRLEQEQQAAAEQQQRTEQRRAYMARQAAKEQAEQQAQQQTDMAANVDASLEARKGVNKFFSDITEFTAKQGPSLADQQACVGCMFILDQIRSGTVQVKPHPLTPDRQQPAAGSGFGYTVGNTEEGLNEEESKVASYLLSQERAVQEEVEASCEQMPEVFLGACEEMRKAGKALEEAFLPDEKPFATCKEVGICTDATLAPPKSKVPAKPGFGDAMGLIGGL